MPTGKPWTVREVARLKALWAEGLHAAVIARELGRTEGAVKTMAVRNREIMPRRKSPPGEKGQVAHIYLSHFTRVVARQEIAKSRLPLSMAGYIKTLIRVAVTDERLLQRVRETMAREARN